MASCTNLQTALRHVNHSWCYWGWFVFWTDGSKRDVAIKLQETSWISEFFERKEIVLSGFINFLLNIIDDSSFSHCWKKLFQVEISKVLYVINHITKNVKWFSNYIYRKIIN